MTTTIYSRNVQRLLGLVLSTPTLPADLREDLARWDAAVGRGAPPTDLEAWAGQLASKIEALGLGIGPDVVGFPTPPSDPPTYLADTWAQDPDGIGFLSMPFSRV